MPEEESAVSPVPLPIRLFGWLLAVLSVLNLIEELSVAKVRGLLRTWLNAYDELVGRVCTFLFGWIDWQWIRLDEAEQHVLVIGLLLGSVVGRASYQTERSRGNPASPIIATMRGVAGIGGLVALPLFLLPAPAGLWIGLMLAFLIFASAVIGGRLVDQDYVQSSHIRRELLVVGATVAIILLLSRLLTPS